MGETDKQFEKISEEYMNEILSQMEEIVPAIHQALKMDYINRQEKAGATVNENLITAARYTFDQCDVANFQLAEPQLQAALKNGLREIDEVSFKFRPFIQKLGKIGQHYALLLHYRGMYFGFDIASAQFGKLPVDQFGGKREGHSLIFPGKSQSEVLEKFEKLYGGKVELGYHQYD